MQEIRLAQGVWKFDEAQRLGPPGGFGDVFRGVGDNGDVAVKRLKIGVDAAAHRELRLGEALSQRDLKHVVPVFDSGQDAQSDRYFIVMPICDRSLRDKIEADGPMVWGDAKGILVDIMDGLAEVPDIVHRDLKPGNVLFHEGTWKIADFGIAKFVEESTSLDTLRHSLTALYAAPEQWQFHAPTSATDVYALGCIVYALLTGSPPFIGTSDELRHAHLNLIPKPIAGLDPRINSVVQAMLRKASNARPDLSRCRSVITSPSPAANLKSFDALGVAGLQVASRKASEDAKLLAQKTQAIELERHCAEAIAEMNSIMLRMFEVMTSATQLDKAGAYSVQLGRAKLEFSTPKKFAEKLPMSGWDVVAWSMLVLECDIERVSHADQDKYSLSSSIVYSKLPNSSDYRWREVSFWQMGGNSWQQPFGLPPGEREFDLAFSKVLAATSPAFGPVTIDAEDEQSFQDRWLGLFARAAQGKLRPPRQLPPPTNFYEP